MTANDPRPEDNMAAWIRTAFVVVSFVSMGIIMTTWITDRLSPMALDIARLEERVAALQQQVQWLIENNDNRGVSPSSLPPIANIN